jgi:transcriptional regulator with XRE-family HTH domain
MEIGEKIRNLRLASELTQEELAERAGLTKGFISQIENDLTSISLDSLEHILTALGTTLAAFFTETAEERVIHPTSHRTTIVKERVKSFQLLVPGATNRKMEPALVTLGPGQSTEETEPYPGEEFGFVLKGRIAIILGKRVYHARRGDSFYFSADRHHRLQNVGKGEATILWVTCPPYF